MANDPRTLDQAITEDTKNWTNEILGSGSPMGMLSFDTKSSFHASLAVVPYTDMDVAEWIAQNVGNRYTFVSSTKTGGDWYYWDGHLHVMDNVNTISDKLAKAYAKALTDVAVFMIQSIGNSSSLTSDDKDKYTKIVINEVMSYAKNIKGEVGLARIRNRLTRELAKPKEYFDNDTDYIVMSDGRVLMTDDLSIPPADPDPSRPVTKKLAVTLGGTDTRPGEWQALLNRLGLPEDDQRFLQVAAGAALLGRGNAKNIVTLVGVSNTGKTTYAMTLFNLFGSYAGSLPPGAIVDKNGTNFDQYKARGKRYVLLEEPYEKRTDDSYLKNLAGAGGLVNTQEKGKNGVEWKAQCVLHITANHVPKINTQDDAIVGRVNIVAFDKVKTPAQQEAEAKASGQLVKEKGEMSDHLLRDCGNEIFMWILAGAQTYNETNTIPKSVGVNARALDGVVSGSVVIRWLTDAVYVQEDGSAPLLHIVDQPDFAHTNMAPATRELYGRFVNWCEDNNEKPIPSKKAWQDEINAFRKEPPTAKGLRPGGSVRLWGLRLPDAPAKPGANDSSGMVQIAPNRARFGQHL